MLKYILSGIAAVVALILILAAREADIFTIQRSALIKAAPDKIFAQIDDFHQWANWSPWEKIDPALKRTFSGAAAGKGAVYEWEGNNQVGSGRMEILDSPAPHLVNIKLDFIKPFEGHNTATFSLSSQGDSTLVVWAMSGPVPFFGKIIHVFFNMDKMIGGNFETGLAQLKSIAEAGNK